MIATFLNLLLLMACGEPATKPELLPEMPQDCDTAFLAANNARTRGRQLCPLPLCKLHTDAEARSVLAQ